MGNPRLFEVCIVVPTSRDGIGNVEDAPLGIGHEPRLEGEVRLLAGTELGNRQPREGLEVARPRGQRREAQHGCVWTLWVFPLPQDSVC